MAGITSAVNLIGSIGLSALQPARSTYSFLDLSGAISHPTTGSYPFIGKGIGRVNLSWEGERTFHEIDVYGNTIIGRSPTGGGGKITIECQQTSEIHYWLSSTFLKVVSSDVVADWAKMGLLLRSVSTGVQFTFRGVTFTKIPDITYGSDGTMIAWVLMFAGSRLATPNPTGAGASIVSKVRSIVGI